ncbi:MAG: hypothetical protein AB7S70_00255 [Hyphomicrobium sp.]
MATFLNPRAEVAAHRLPIGAESHYTPSTTRAARLLMSPSTAPRLVLLRHPQAGALFVVAKRPEDDAFLPFSTSFATLPAEIMQPVSACCAAEDPIDAARRTPHEHQATSLPVIDKAGGCCSTVSSTGVVKS